MMAAVRIPVLQGSPEWLAARRELVTATDVGVLLGVNPYRCEADLAAEKLGTAEPTESNVRMRIGLALEPLIAAEYEAATGRKVRRVHGLWRHSSVTWAGASPDFAVVGERRLVETKWSGSRSRFADGLPEDIEAQAAWQMFVSGYPACDVAALAGDELRVFEVRADDGLAKHLVAIAADFRRRLAAGGPFAESTEFLRRSHPADDGSEMVADPDIEAAMRALRDVRGRLDALKGDEEALKVAVQTRMADAARLVGDGWTVTWKRTKDRTETDWKALAADLLATMPEPDRIAVVGSRSTVVPGYRPWRVAWGKGEDAS